MQPSPSPALNPRIVPISNSRQLQTFPNHLGDKSYNSHTNHNVHFWKLLSLSLFNTAICFSTITQGWITLQFRLMLVSLRLGLLIPSSSTKGNDFRERFLSVYAVTCGWREGNWSPAQPTDRVGKKMCKNEQSCIVDNITPQDNSGEDGKGQRKWDYLVILKMLTMAPSVPGQLTVHIKNNKFNHKLS